ncbi:hypothetical protein Hanom_Chr00s006654g01735201 [Helianthus anomalus]
MLFSNKAFVLDKKNTQDIKYSIMTYPDAVCTCVLIKLKASNQLLTKSSNPSLIMFYHSR